jgi:hypothetical protein
MGKVRPDPTYGTGGCYIIEHEGGYSCLGFDVALDRLERYALDLRQDTEPVDRMMATFRPLRGTMAVYERMRALEVALVEREQTTGERSCAELSPQLIGLEGYRVEVVTTYGERRRFIVGKSTGPIPCHLEIARRDSSGGIAAAREYKSVKALERVR